MNFVHDASSTMRDRLSVVELLGDDVSFVNNGDVYATGYNGNKGDETRIVWSNGDSI